LGRVQISTVCVHENLAAAGGFGGELVVRNLHQEGVACSTHITLAENGITNAIEIFQTPAHAPRVMVSNNDQAVRILDGQTFQCVSRFMYEWAVNFSTVCPRDAGLMAVVGDDPDALLVDTRQGGRPVHKLQGHLDYSFAAAWHPDGWLLATGNQDVTTRIWDVRMPGSSMCMLQGRMGAIRSLRFSSDGKFLAVAEPADFVHIHDVASGFAESQEIDLFGEIAGVSFSPDARKLSIGVADMTYSSLVQFDRYQAGSLPRPRLC
jgi:WD40 repeat protein